MDRLDRFSVAAIVILMVGSIALISLHTGEARQDRNLPQRTASADNTPGKGEVEGAVRGIRNLMETDNLGKAELLIQELIQKYPYEGEPHMLRGDTFMRRQEPVKAVLEYREAIDLNPDYLDTKTPLFQGKKLKIAVREALAETEKGMRLNPGDESLKRDRKVIYYLQRKIAGSCG